MARASGVTLEITARDLPVLPGALALALQYLPCGGRANLKFYTGFTTAPTVSPEWHLICQDPQTSGGLLLAVRPSVAGEFMRQLAALGGTATVIGHVGPSRGSDDVLVQLQ
jgi:selenide,water dikinase